MDKRLIAIMLSAGITITALTGCGGTSKSSDEIRNENEIRQMLEYDANTNLSKENVRENGFKVEYKINNEKFYITFITQEWYHTYRYSKLEDRAKITYEVDKDTYYKFRNDYSLEESEQDVELIKALTEKFDPISVINPEGNIIQE